MLELDISVLAVVLVVSYLMQQGGRVLKNIVSKIRS